MDQEEENQQQQQHIQEKRKHWVIFKEDGNETEPFLCDSELVYDDNQHCIIHKKIITVDIFHIDLYITYKNKDGTGNWEFVRGFLYKNNEEYVIKSFVTFASLQRGQFGYDNVGICCYSKNH
jgi:hypothetical protein